MMVVIMDVHFSLKADMTLRYNRLNTITFIMPAQLAHHPPPRWQTPEPLRVSRCIKAARRWENEMVT
ncbi:hypothetical protein ACQFZU_000081 [Cronobacter dublinensis]